MNTPKNPFSHASPVPDGYKIVSASPANTPTVLEGFIERFDAVVKKLQLREELADGFSEQAYLRNFISSEIENLKKEHAIMLAVVKSNHDQLKQAHEAEIEKAKEEGRKEMMDEIKESFNKLGFKTL